MAASWSVQQPNVKHGAAAGLRSTHHSAPRLSTRHVCVLSVAFAGSRWAMSANRPKRAAAADADWLIRQRKELIARASSSSSAASHVPFDSDDDDESYIPSSAAHKRQRIAAAPLQPADEPAASSRGILDVRSQWC